MRYINPNRRIEFQVTYAKGLSKSAHALFQDHTLTSDLFLNQLNTVT